MVVIFVLLVVLLTRGSSHLPLLIPGLMVLPLYALIPCLGGKAVPLSLPTEEAKSAGRGLSMIGAMMFAFVLAAVSSLAWNYGLFIWFLIVEGVATIAIYAALRAGTRGARWEPIE